MSKVLNVFYGADRLPYKDQERQVHYPMVGNSFAGASLVDEIRFYAKDLGTENNVFVGIAKRPDGQRGYQVLTYGYDAKLNEPYWTFNVSGWFTEKVGNVFVSLNVYQGGVDIEVDEDSGLAIVSGTPIIQATGSVVLSINYAPVMDNGYGAVPTIDVQEALSLVSSKVDTDYLTANYYNKTTFETAIQGIEDELDAKANKSETYDRDYIDGKLDLKADKTTTTSLQNQINDLNSRLVVVEEAIIGVDTLTFTALSYSAIPNVSDNLYPLIQSGGLDTKEIKGNSFVHSQLVQNGNFVDASGWGSSGSTLSAANNTLTLTTTTTASWAALYRTISIVSGHKYLVKAQVKCSENTNYFRATLGSKACSTVQLTANQSYAYSSIVEYDGSGSGYIYFYPNYSAGISEGATLEIGNVQCFDLTKDFGAGNEPTTYDQAVSMYASKGIDITNYVEYTQGTLIDSKPVKLISRGYNLCEELWESGTIYNGSNYPSDVLKRTPSTDRIKVVGGKSYTIEGNETGNYYIFEFDTEMNQIRRDDFNNSQGGNVSLLSNCSYVRLVVPTELTQCCFHFTGSRTGYAPYKAPIEYPITTEVLRSAGSVQDSATSKKVGAVDLGTLDGWTKSGNKFYVSFPDAKAPTSSSSVANIRCSLYTADTQDNYANETHDNIICISVGGAIGVYDSSKASLTAAQFKTAMSGVILNYELATPTEQTATLPTDIEIEKGGSLEVVYDNGYTTPADFVFDSAVYKPLE
jgi:hypothetical protein